MKPEEPVDQEQEQPVLIRLLIVDGPWPRLR